MITIIFEAHATTTDNEAHLASGHNDPELTALGIKQARELGDRYAHQYFDVIYCSDLQRSYRTAEIAFAGRNFTIIPDARLRECDYGDHTGHPSEEVEAEKPKRIAKPFPNGESYEETTARMKDFLNDLYASHNGRRVMIIGHRATQYALDHLIGVKEPLSLKEAVTKLWKWQPGWTYKLEKPIP